MKPILETRRRCVFCGGNSLVEFLRLEDFPIYMGTVEGDESSDQLADQVWAACSDCNGVQLQSLVPLDLLYSQNHSDPIGEIWTSHHREFGKFVLRHSDYGKLIEIGGASGKLASEILTADPNFFTEYKIVEPDPGEGVSGVTLVRGVIEEHLDELDGAATIVHSHVLEHLYDPLATLRKIVGRMGVGSRMILSFPNLERILEQGAANGLNFEHTYFLSPKDLLGVVSDSGLRVLEMEAFRDHSVFVSAEKQDGSPEHEVRLFDKSGAVLLTEVWAKTRLVAGKFNAELNARSLPSGYLFGAHVFSQALLRSGIPNQSVRGILDNSQLKIGKRLYGTPHKVMSPLSISQEDAPVVAVIASHYQEEIKAQLRAINPSVVIVE